MHVYRLRQRGSVAILWESGIRGLFMHWAEVLGAYPINETGRESRIGRLNVVFSLYLLTAVLHDYAELAYPHAIATEPMVRSWRRIRVQVRSPLVNARSHRSSYR
jgi:hypothetical protein